MEKQTQRDNTMLRFGQEGSWLRSHAFEGFALVQLQPMVPPWSEKSLRLRDVPSGSLNSLLDHTLGSQDMGISCSNGPSLLPGSVWTSFPIFLSASVCILTKGCGWSLDMLMGYFHACPWEPLLFGMEMYLLRGEEIAVFCIELQGVRSLQLSLAFQHQVS